MILLIDSTDSDKIQVVVKRKDGKTQGLLSSRRKIGSQLLLAMIDKILKRNNLIIKDIKSIEVNPGPGSFTGSRVGVAIANALAFGLDLPLNSRKNYFETPIYETSKFDKVK